MATVDEIMAAVELYGEARTESALADYLDNDKVAEDAALARMDGHYDRIRSMLAPVAPDPALREAIAKRMYEETAGYLEKTSLSGDSIPWEDSYERDLYLKRVDLVLAMRGEGSDDER